MVDHGVLSQTACYKDDCLTYLSEKNSAGYFPRGKEQPEEKIYFNIIYREPVEEEYDEETLPNDQFDDKVVLPVLEAEDLPQISEEEEVPLPFEEGLAGPPLPEYLLYANPQYQEWAMEGVRLQERIQNLLQRNIKIVIDLKIRRDENSAFSR